MKKSSFLLSFLFLAFFDANSSPLSKAGLLFKTSDEATKSMLLNNPNSTFGMMRMNMYALTPNGTSFLVDGTLTQYDDDFSKSVDGMDARKLTNPGENIGMIRDNKILIIESRQTISVTDTIFFKMWGMQKRSYQMQFVGTNLNHPGLHGFLEDTYLKSSTSINLNDTTKVTFAVNNDTASASMYRFRLVFSTVTQVTLPFVFTSVNGYWKNNRNIVEWETQNEMNLSKYIVERSVVGKGFFDEAPVSAHNNSTGNYQWIDENPVPGNNYYRVRSVDMDGKIEYSKIVEIHVEKSGQRITVYPNPATVDNLNLQLNNKEAGLYEVQLITTFGQTLITKTFNYIGGNGKEKINLGTSIPKGIYQLQIKDPQGDKKLIRVVF
jgi:hypothetical protein